MLWITDKLLIVDLAKALNKPVTFVTNIELYGLLYKEFDRVVVIGSE